MSWHVGVNGVSKCRATPGNCPLKGIDNNPSKHFDNIEEARWDFEKQASIVFKETPKRKTLSTVLLNKCGDRYPKETLVKLGDYLDAQPYTTLNILPAGSHLYGTQIPGKVNHDYDFTAFVTPDSGLSKVKHYMDDELDLNVINITQIPVISARSTPFSESFFALQAGRSLVEINNNWTPFVHSLRIPPMRYFGLLSDVIKSQSHEFHEPVDMNAGLEFKNFKHVARWSIYYKRFGSRSMNTHFVDPVLSLEERELWLKTLYSGRMETLYN